MANIETAAGVNSFVLLGKETAYAVEQSTCNTHLCMCNNFSPSIGTDMKHRRANKTSTTAGRTIVKSVPGVETHELTLDGDVFNWSFLEYVLGSVSGTSTKTYTMADVLPSFTLDRPIDNPGSSATDQNGVWLGTIVESVSIKASKGNPVEVSFSLKSAKRNDTTTIIAAVDYPSLDIYNFTGASLELPTGVAFPNIIDNFELTLTNNFDLRPGIGSKHAQNAIAQGFDIKLSVDFAYLNNDIKDAVLANTVYDTLKLGFANSTDTCDLTLTNVIIDDHSSKEKVAETITENISITGQTITAVETIA